LRGLDNEEKEVEKLADKPTLARNTGCMVGSQSGAAFGLTPS
jgi:hypothetical protein